MFIFLILLLSSINCIYDVPSYYGHFSKNFFTISHINLATFRYFQYHYSVDLDSSNKTVYIVDSAKHCIYKFDLQTQKKLVLAGQCGTSGNRVGGLNVMLLNNPMSVVSYQPNLQSQQSENNMKVFITSNQNCNLESVDCILSAQDAANYNLSIKNIRLYPPIQQFPPINYTQPTYLYVSDTGNHCIKKIDLTLKTSRIVAGQCGTSGFTDGPTGFNKLNRPTNLGITRTGTLYFYDEGNQYMRKLDVNGNVYTLLNGACKYYGESRRFGGGYKLNNILCYDNWIQTTTKAPIQHVIDSGEINICTEHSSKC